MVSRSTRKSLTAKERQFWCDAFLIAFSAALRKDGDAVERSLSGLRRAAAEAAWAAVDELRLAVKGKRS